MKDIFKNIKRLFFLGSVGRRLTDENSLTLIELLIVMGLLGFMAATTAAALNPVQMMAQARDSRRLQDLKAIQGAVNTVQALDQGIFLGNASTVYASLPDDASSTCGSWGLPPLPNGWTYHCVSGVALRKSNGAGWIPIDFAGTGVVSLSPLPIDPVNASSSGEYYTYTPRLSWYEVAASLESRRYGLGGAADAVSTDGGVYPDLYEGGSSLAILPVDYGSQGLVALLPLDEGSGTIAYDHSIYGGNGTWNSSSTENYIVDNGQPVGHFTPSGNYVGGGPKNQYNVTHGLTIHAWAYLTSYGNNQGIVYYGNGFTNFYGLNNTPSAVQFYMGGSVCSGPALQLDAWSAIDGVYDGKKMYTYINGAPVNACNGGSFPGNSDGNLFVGNKWNAGGDPFIGNIRNITIYNYAMSADQIRALYVATK